MNTITYTRPSGSTLTVSDNEANREHAKANGWVEVGKEVKQPPVKDKKPAK